MSDVISFGSVVSLAHESGSSLPPVSDSSVPGLVRIAIGQSVKLAGGSVVGPPPDPAALAHVALGWDVLSATVEPRDGRLVVVAGYYWCRDASNGLGFSGFDGNAFYGVPTIFQADSRAVLAAMIEWLCGKASGATCLIAGADPATSFRSDLRAGLSALGHSYTLSGVEGGFGAYDPLAFDVLFAPTTLDATSYHGHTSSESKFDYILSHRGRVIIETGSGGAHTFARYGIDQLPTLHSGHAGAYGSPDFKDQRPFDCAPFGASEYRLVYASDQILGSGTNVMGGASAIYICKKGHTPSEGVIGLWTSGAAL